MISGSWDRSPGRLLCSVGSLLRDSLSPSGPPTAHSLSLKINKSWNFLCRHFLNLPIIFPYCSALVLRLIVSVPSSLQKIINLLVQEGFFCIVLSSLALGLQSLPFVATADCMRQVSSLGFINVSQALLYWLSGSTPYSDCRSFPSRGFLDLPSPSSSRHVCPFLCPLGILIPCKWGEASMFPRARARPGAVPVQPPHRQAAFGTWSFPQRGNQNWTLNELRHPGAQDVQIYSVEFSWILFF